MRTVGTRWVTLRSIFAFAALLAAAGVHAQSTVTIRAANSVNNQILGVLFAPPGTTVLNTDQKSLYSLQSLVLVTNPDTFSVDLFAADNQNGKILDYSGDFCPAFPNASPPTPACKATGTVVPQAAGIIYPNGLSADTKGDLFVVNDAPGKSPLPQVWVVPFQGGSFQSAVQIDSTSPTGSLGKQQAVVETMIVGAPLGTPGCAQQQPPTCAANTGDLLVVSNSPDEILLYPGNGATGPSGQNHSPGTLILQCSKPGAQNCIPAGSLPKGIAAWPADNSLLITTSSGSILRFSLAGGSVMQMTPVSGLPSGLYKIKTGLQNGAASAFVAQSGPGNHGSILELGPSPNNGITFVTAVTAGVAAPEGIAVTNAVVAAAATCQQVTGCNLLGGGDPKHNVLTHFAKNGSLQGNIIEDVCIVPADPRPLTAKGACGDATLLVNQVCPGFDNTGNFLVIPGYLCGGPNGFALVKTLTTHAQDQPGNVSEWNGTYVESSADSTQLIKGANNPVCGPPSSGVGIGTLVWAPLMNEGTIFEGPIMVDVTDGCGTGHGGSGYTSLWAINLALDTTAQELQGPLATPLENFAQTKYTNKIGTINTFSTNHNINNPTVLHELYNNNSQTSPGCIDISLADYVIATTVDTINSAQWRADMQNAADLLTDDDTSNNTTCDTIVVNNPGSFVETSSPLVLNPSGQIRSRLANLYYTINTDILGNPAPAAWPPPVSTSVSVSMQTVSTTDTPTLVWGLKGNVGPCAVSTTENGTDPHFVPPTGIMNTGSATLGPWTAPGTYLYTLTCPNAAGTINTAVSTRLTVQAPPAVQVCFGTPPLASCVQTLSQPDETPSVPVTWIPPPNATGCSLTFVGGHGSLSGPPTVSGNPPNYTTSYLISDPADELATVTFTATCAAGASPGNAALTVTLDNDD